MKRLTDMNAHQPVSVYRQYAPAGVLHIVLVGEGFSSLSPAFSLARQPVWVTSIEHNNDHLFQQMLYQIATSGLAPADIAEIIHKQHTTVQLEGVKGVETQIGNWCTYIQ